MGRKKSKNYVNNKEFYETLCKALPHFRETGKWGKYGDKIGLIVLEMIERIKNKSNFKNYKGRYWDLMYDRAMINIWSYIKGYNLERKNPFSYFTTVIVNAFKNALSELNRGNKEIPYDNDVINNMIDTSSSHEFENDLIDEMDDREFEYYTEKSMEELQEIVENIEKGEEHNEFDIFTQ